MRPHGAGDHRRIADGIGRERGRMQPDVAADPTGDVQQGHRARRVCELRAVSSAGRKWRR